MPIQGLYRYSKSELKFIYSEKATKYMNFNKIKYVKHCVNEEVNFCLFFIRSFNISLFRDVDTIQDFTDILFLDSCGLLDESGRLAE